MKLAFLKGVTRNRATTDDLDRHETACARGYEPVHHVQRIRNDQDVIRPAFVRAAMAEPLQPLSAAAGRPARPWW
jgi:hypothetical protein